MAVAVDPVEVALIAGFRRQVAEEGVGEDVVVRAQHAERVLAGAAPPIDIDLAGRHRALVAVANEIDRLERGQRREQHAVAVEAVDRRVEHRHQHVGVAGRKAVQAVAGMADHVDHAIDAVRLVRGADRGRGRVEADPLAQRVEIVRIERHHRIADARAIAIAFGPGHAADAVGGEQHDARIDDLRGAEAEAERRPVVPGDELADPGPRIGRVANRRRADIVTGDERVGRCERGGRDAKPRGDHRHRGGLQKGSAQSPASGGRDHCGPQESVVPGDLPHPAS